MLVKLYGHDPRGEETRYSPAECIGCRSIPIVGQPRYSHISMSFAERENLTMRMKMRRFRRLKNAFPQSSTITDGRLHYTLCTITLFGFIRRFG